MDMRRDAELLLLLLLVLLRELCMEEESRNAPPPNESLRLRLDMIDAAVVSVASIYQRLSLSRYLQSSNEAKGTVSSCSVVVALTAKKMSLSQVRRSPEVIFYPHACML